MERETNWICAVDGSEIRRLPVDAVNIHTIYLQGFVTAQVVVWDFWIIEPYYWRKNIHLFRLRRGIFFVESILPRLDDQNSIHPSAAFSLSWLHWLS